MDIDYLPPTDATIIWLHGLGADGRDFEALPTWLGRPHTRYVLPDAPERPVTLHGGARIRAWFDLYGLGPASPVDWDGLDAAATQVADLVTGESTRPHHPPVVLGGFSQGGALALYAGLSRALPVVGLVGLSTYLPPTPDETWVQARPPVFLAHGLQDTVIPLTTGRTAATRLSRAGVDLEWSTWPMGHGVHPEELAALTAWMSRILAPGPHADV